MLEIILAYELFIFETEAWMALSVRMVVYQPQFFPRLHYFARILNSEIYGIADNVQFVRKHAYHTQEGNRAGVSYQAHTPLLTNNGVLLADIATESGFKAINETKLVYTARNDKGRPHRLIREHYRKAREFRRIDPALEAFFSRDFDSVGELNIASTYFALAILLEKDPLAADRTTLQAALAESPYRLRQLELLSESGVPVSDKDCGRCANQWLVECCQRYGADEYYYGGTGASAYMDFSKFDAASIRLIEQSWKCEPYRQTQDGFVSNLSIIDLLMNVPPEKAREVVFTQ